MKKYQNRGSVDGSFEQFTTPQEQMLLQYEMNLPKLYTAPSQRFADIAPIHNAQYASEFTPNLSYSPYISKYIGDTVPLETGLLQLDDLNKQAYESIVPTIKIGDALEADYGYRDKLKAKYENDIKTISEDPNISLRNKTQKIRQLRTDFNNDEQRRSIEGSMSAYRNLAAQMDERIKAGKATEGDKKAMLTKYLNDYKAKGGIGAAPSESGAYNIFSGENLAEQQDLVKEVNSMISGWASNKHGGDVTTDYQNGMYIFRNKQGNVVDELTAEEVQKHIQNMLVNNPLVRADVRQRATVRAINEGNDNPETINKYENQILSEAINYGTDKASFRKVDTTIENTMRGDSVALDNRRRADRKAQNDYEQGLVTQPTALKSQRNKMPTTLDKNDPEWQKSKDTWVEAELEKMRKDPNLIREYTALAGGNYEAGLDAARAELQGKYDKEFGGSPSDIMKLRAKKSPLAARLLEEELAKEKLNSQNRTGNITLGGLATGNFGDRELGSVNEDAAANRAYAREQQLLNNSNEFGFIQTFRTDAESQELVKKLNSREFDALPLPNGEPFGRWMDKNFASISVTDSKTGEQRAAKNPDEARNAVQGGGYNPYRGTYEVRTDGKYGENVFEIPASLAKQQESKIFMDANRTMQDGRERTSTLQIGNAVTPVKILPTTVGEVGNEAFNPDIVFEGIDPNSDAYYYKVAELYSLAYPTMSQEKLSQVIGMVRSNGGKIPIQDVEVFHNKTNTTGGMHSKGKDAQGDTKATYNYTEDNNYNIIPYE